MERGCPLERRCGGRALGWLVPCGAQCDARAVLVCAPCLSARGRWRWVVLWVTADCARAAAPGSWALEGSGGRTPLLWELQRAPRPPPSRHPMRCLSAQLELRNPGSRRRTLAAVLLSSEPDGPGESGAGAPKPRSRGPRRAGVGAPNKGGRPRAASARRAWGGDARPRPRARVGAGPTRARRPGASPAAPRCAVAPGAASPTPGLSCRKAGQRH